MAEETLKTVISQLRINQKANTQELEYLNSQIMGLNYDHIIGIFSSVMSFLKFLNKNESSPRINFLEASIEISSKLIFRFLHKA